MIERYEKVWGSEEWIVNNDKYCGKILNLSEGYRCSVHHHEKKHETFYVLSGKVLMENNGAIRLMTQGDVQAVEPFQKHRFSGMELSRIIEFSTHHEENDSYRETQSGKIPADEFLKLKVKYG
jgi:mannose-6-phosphate isomerase-like protein (cupin superfamily)